MSLIDPSTHWWNRGGPRRIAAGVCWVVSIALSLVAGWATTGALGPSGADAAPAWLIPIAATTSLLLLLAGVFLWIVGGRFDEFDPRVVFMPLAATFVAQGVGETIHAVTKGVRPQTVSIVFMIVGAVALVVTHLIARALVSHRALQARVEHAGVVTTGRVTRTLGYFIDHSPVTRVVVEFTDTDGRTRWITKTVGGRLQNGAPLTVRYLPDELGRRAAVTVSRR